MNNFNRHEANCSLSSAGLFEDRLRQEDVIAGYWEKINPINSSDRTQVMEFLVKGNDDFIDLHNCYIQLKIRVKTTDGTNLAENKEIGCINYPIAALFNTSTSTSTMILLQTRPTTATTVIWNHC